MSGAVAASPLGVAGQLAAGAAPGYAGVLVGLGVSFFAYTIGVPILTLSAVATIVFSIFGGFGGAT